MSCGTRLTILNAGVMACPFALSLDGYEMQFATNHLGHFFLVEKVSDAPRG
jgi:NAD(P)-dependent dehydrogenase (short-subunit alcohol dehydrogenase family)